jgi:3',5'-cyclic AMP phosphodiesterase CpdA
VTHERPTPDAPDAPTPPASDPDAAAPGPAPDAARSPDPPDAAPAPRPLFVAVISDLNGSYGDPTYEAPVHTAVRRIIAVRPDLVLCAGDMVAGQQAGLDYRAMWRGFHDAVSDPLAAAGIPLAVSPGNHDASGYGGFEEERRIYADEWSARRPAVTFTEDADYPFRYAFTVGAALFVALDDTLVGPMRPAQRDWVGARLGERADLPAKIVFGHVPIHPFTQGRESEILDDSALEDLLIEQGVTAFISGHHHGYFPGRHRGLRQVSMPCLGSGPRALVGTQGATPRGLVFLRIEGETITELDGYTGADLTTRIERASLPESVGVVRRDDL